MSRTLVLNALLNPASHANNHRIPSNILHMKTLLEVQIPRHVSFRHILNDRPTETTVPQNQPDEKPANRLTLRQVELDQMFGFSPPQSCGFRERRKCLHLSVKIMRANRIRREDDILENENKKPNEFQNIFCLGKINMIPSNTFYFPCTVWVPFVWFFVWLVWLYATFLSSVGVLLLFYKVCFSISFLAKREA